MAICGSCGAETSRIHFHTQSPDGKPLPKPYDTCPYCRPEEFEERFLSPSDRRFHMEWETDPNKYDTLIYDDGEVVPKIKDWAKGECEQEIIDAPEQQKEIDAAIERKRAFARERNKRPMSQEEINRTVNLVRSQMEESDRAVRAMDAGLVLPV